MDVRNPVTGKLEETYETESAADGDDALDDAAETFDRWQNRPPRERERPLAAAGAELRANDRSYAETITREMGKPISQALDEIAKCAWVCDHYAEHASTYLNPDGHPSPPGPVAKTAYEPLGPQLAVMPRNFPFWQVFRFAAPALTAGSVVLLKHASNVPGCARAIENAFQRAGYPDDALRTLLIGSDLVDERCSKTSGFECDAHGERPRGTSGRIDGGSTTQKERPRVGGSDPFIVLDDADIDATGTGASARILNGGQSCIAAKRFLVHTDVYDAFLERFVDEVEALAVVDPTGQETDVGPLASSDFLEELDTQVQASLEAGARATTGGEPLDREGAYTTTRTGHSSPSPTSASRDGVHSTRPVRRRSTTTPRTGERSRTASGSLERGFETNRPIATGNSTFERRSESIRHSTYPPTVCGIGR